MGYSNVLPAWLFLPNNKGKKMNEATLSVEDFEKAKDILRNSAIKYNEQGNPIVPVNSSATMEFQTETVKNEG